MTHTSNSNHSRLREEDLKFEISWSYIEAIPPHLKTEKKKSGQEKLGHHRYLMYNNIHVLNKDSQVQE